MPHTLLYCAPAAGGLGNGSTPADPLQLFPAGSLNSAFTGIDYATAGAVARLLPGNYVQSTTITTGTFTVAPPTGTTHYRLQFEGVASDGGPLPVDLGWKCAAGDTVTTGWPVWDGGVSIAASVNVAFRGLKLSGTTTTGTTLINNFNGTIEFCDLTYNSSHASATVVALNNTAAMVNSTVRVTGSAWNRILAANAAGNFSNVRLKGAVGASSGNRYGVQFGSNSTLCPGNGPLFICDCPGYGMINSNNTTAAGAQASRLTIVNCGTGIGVLVTSGTSTSHLQVDDSVITGCTVGLEHAFGRFRLLNTVLRNTTNFSTTPTSYVAEPYGIITTEADAALYVNSAGGDYRIKPTSSHWNKNRGAQDGLVSGAAGFPLSRILN